MGVAWVSSEQITAPNATVTAREFEHYIQEPHCLGFKLYPGYNDVYVNDKRHWPYLSWQRPMTCPVVIHTGDTANPKRTIEIFPSLDC